MPSVYLKRDSGYLWSNSGGVFTAFEWSANFTVSANRYLRELAWYRVATGAGNKPTTLRLWRASTGVLIYSAPSIPDDGAVGWQTHTVETEVELLAGVEYRVSAAMGAGVNFAFVDADPLAPPSPFSHASPDTHAVAGSGFPNSVPGDTTWHVGLEVGVDTTPPDVLTVTRPFLQNELASYLSVTDAAGNTDSFPTVIHDLLTDPSAGLDAIKSLSDTLIATVETALGPGGDFTMGAVRTVLEAWYDALSSALNNTPDVIMGPGNPTIADVMTAVSDLDGGTCHFPYPVAAPTYTAGTPESHTGSAVITTPADAYIIVIDDVGEEARSAVGVGGVTINWLRGWAKPWDGTAMYPDHFPLNGPATVIVSGNRWPGALIWFPPDIEWTITPYDLA